MKASSVGVLGLCICAYASSAGARPKSAVAGRSESRESYCLAYPSGVLPSFAEMAATDIDPMAVRFSPTGRKIALSDPYKRVVVWNAVAGAKPTQYAGIGSVQAISDSGGLYLLGNRGGQLGRLDLATGSQSISCAACFGPEDISETVGEGGRYLVATRRADESKNATEIVVLDECLIAKISRAGYNGCRPDSLKRFIEECGPGVAPGLLPISCQAEQRRLLLRGTEARAAQIDGDDLVALERRSELGGLETVVRDPFDGHEKQRWKTDDVESIRALNGSLVEWSSSSGTVTVRDKKSAAIVHRVSVFSDVPTNTSCVNLESAAGRWAVFHRAWASGVSARWRILDVTTGAIVWSSNQAHGGVGVSALGQIAVADRRGVCVTAARN